jgi:PTS system mannose-specific IIB component
MTDVNIGGIAQKNPDKDILVTKSVYTNKEDALKLKELKDNYGVENIYFQATPAASSTSLETVLTKFD